MAKPRRVELMALLKEAGIHNYSKAKLSELEELCRQHGLLEDATVNPPVSEEEIKASLVEQAKQFEASRVNVRSMRDYNPETELKKQLSANPVTEDKTVSEPITQAPVEEVAAEKKEVHMSDQHSIKAVIRRTRMFGKKNMPLAKAPEGKSLHFERVNSSEMGKAVGYKVYPILKKEKDENGKEFDVYVDCDITTGDIAVPIHHPHFQYLKSGDLVVCKIFSSVPEHRKVMLNALMDRIREITIEKYGVEKVVVTTKPHERNKLIFFGFKEVWDKIFSCDIYKKDAPKLEGYCAPTVFKYAGDDEKINLLHIDGGIFARTILDGNIHINRSMTYQTFVSDKAWQDGAKAKLEDLFAMQKRATGTGEDETNCLIKGLLVTDKSGDIFRSLGLPLDKWDGFTLDHNVKASRDKLANLETITINASSIRGINMRPRATKSRIGVQGTCLNPIPYRSLVVEMGQIEKAQVWKRAVEGDLLAIEQIIGEIDPESSFEDSDTILIKILGDAIKDKDGTYREARHIGLRNVTAHRKAKYFTDSVLKMEVAPLILYSNKLPIAVYYNPNVSKSAMTLVQAAVALSVPFKDGVIDFSSPEYMERIKPYADDALSVYERMEHAETGMLRNYALFYRDEKFRIDKKLVGLYDYYEQFNNLALYRNPVVGPASMQDNYIPGPEFAKWLRGMGFTSVGITSDGKYSCHNMPDVCITSQDQAFGKFEDNDGDFTFLLFSNTAGFGVHRPKLPPELAKGKDVVPTTPHELNELNRLKYGYIIDSAAVTGMLDLIVRSIIEYYRSKGTELSLDWKYWMAWVREWLAIKGIKHTTLLKGESTELPQDLVVRKLMGDKELPPAFTIPETALKHPRIGRGAGKTTSHRMLMDACEQIKRFNEKEDKIKADLLKLKAAGKLTEAKLDSVIATRDPYIDVFRSLNGVKYAPVYEYDSQTLKVRYGNLWKRIVAGERVLPSGYVIGSKTYSAIANFGNRMNREYGKASNKYRSFSDDDRAKAFTELKKWFLEELGVFLKEQAGTHYEARITICDALTVYLGYITFGYTEGDRRSGSGSLKYWMGFESNLAICEILTPDNPYISKLKAMATKAMAKRMGVK